MIKKECCVIGCRRNATIIHVYIGGFSKPLCSVHEEKHETEILYYKKAHMKKYKTNIYDIMI